MIGKLLSGLIGIIGALWLGIAGAWGWAQYERLPAGWPNAEVRCCVVIRFTLHAPFAGSVTAAAASEHQAFLAEKRNFDTVHAAILRQDASIAAENAAGARALAKADLSVRAYRATQAATQARLRAISGQIAGADVCARVRAFDKTFVGTLSQ